MEQPRGGLVANVDGLNLYASPVIVSAFQSHVFPFVGKDRKRAKVLFFEGTGVCILQKRLSKGRFDDAWQRREITQAD